MSAAGRAPRRRLRGARPGGSIDGAQNGFAAVSGAAPGAQMADLERFPGHADRAGNEVANLIGPGDDPGFVAPRSGTAPSCCNKLAPGRSAPGGAKDLGAGAGLPGLVLAITGKGVIGFHVDPWRYVTKRCKFLSEVVVSAGASGSHGPSTTHRAGGGKPRPNCGDRHRAGLCAAISPPARVDARPLPSGRRPLACSSRDKMWGSRDEGSRQICGEYEAVTSVPFQGSDARGRIVRVKRLGRARKV